MKIDLENIRNTRTSASEASTQLDLRPKRELSNLVLDRQFQLRYTLMIATTCAVLTTALGSLVYYFLREASEVVRVRAMDPSDLDAQMLQHELARHDRWLLLALVGFCVVLVSVITVGALRVTHKLAGPLFKIAFHMNEISNGRLSRLGEIRRDDHVRALYETFCRMHESLEQRAKLDVSELDLAIVEARKTGSIELVARLNRLKQDRERFLPKDKKE